MAWRPNEQFICGELDNTVLGKVTGWMKFAGMSENVVFDLDGDFHRDIRGAKIKLRGDGQSAHINQARQYMEGFSTMQKGKVGDMTAGLPPQDYSATPYWEWYSEDNGRCVIELEPEQVELLTQPIPACECDPIDRKQQAEHMADYLCGMTQAFQIPQANAIAVGNTVAVERAKKVRANDKIRGMKLLPKELRDILPGLLAQDGKAGKTVAYIKFFTPDGQWSWYGCEGEPIMDETGSQEVDFQFFGLVFGHEKELGYFNLSELEEVRGPLGLPIERDLYFKPKPLAQIASDLFGEE